jgi:hypothetical protein
MSTPTNNNHWRQRLRSQELSEFMISVCRSTVYLDPSNADLQASLLQYFKQLPVVSRPEYLKVKHGLDIEYAFAFICLVTRKSRLHGLNICFNIPSVWKPPHPAGRHGVGTIGTLLGNEGIIQLWLGQGI